jgi:hypothetical protein
MGVNTFCIVQFLIDIISLIIIFAKIKEMKTIVIQLEENTNYRPIIEAIKQFKGVESAKLASEEQLENLSILKACKAARKSDLVSEDEIFSALK